jgi:hypothetical protein
MNAAERLWQALARRDCNGVRAQFEYSIAPSPSATPR